MQCENCGEGHFCVDSVKNFIVEVKCAECGFIVESVRDLYEGMVRDGANYPPLRRWELWATLRI